MEWKQIVLSSPFPLLHSFSRKQRNTLSLSVAEKAQATEQRYTKLKEKYSELVQNHADLLRKVAFLYLPCALDWMVILCDYLLFAVQIQELLTHLDLPT